MTTSFSRLGLIAEHGMSWLLPRQVGISRTLDLLWSSRRVGMDEALAIGLVDRVLPADALVQAAVDYADALAASVSPRSLAQIKAQVYADLGRSINEAAPDIYARMLASLKHGDVAEGGAALAERRVPNFAPFTGDVE